MKTNVIKTITAYERYLMPAALLGGVFVDFVTFTNISIESAIAVLCVHLLVAAIVIVILNVQVEESTHFFAKIHPYLPYVFQFSVGALLSASFVFYWFSGSLSVSWPFMIIIAAIMLVNESFRHYFEYIPAQVGVYFFSSFSVAAIALAYAVNSLSAWVFVASLVLGLLAALVLLFLILKVKRKQFTFQEASLVSLLGVALVMMLLYFSNLIPPIPLAIRDAAVGHNLLRTEGYLLEEEVQPWWERVVPGQRIHVQEGQRVYAFASVFAPANLLIPVYHHWEYLNPDTGVWESTNRVGYTITGGRTEGYRGYSFTQHPREGRWRIRVETERGQVIGQINVTMILVDEAPETQLIRH